MLLTIEEIHNQIDECVLCSNFVERFCKPASGLNRGTGDEIFVVGQSPGATEVTSQRALSGGSGKRLDNWLVKCGRPASDPRADVYLTSILKCPFTKTSDFGRMAANCRHFIEDQLAIIKPRLVITLGAESFKYLRITNLEYDAAIGELFFPAQQTFFAEQPFAAMVHWPHPSGLNRWHNVTGNLGRLEESFKRVKAFLEEPA